MKNTYPYFKLYDAAAQRVNNDPQLAPHEFLLIKYEWDDEEEHLAWVANAPVSELVSWAAEIEENQRYQAALERLMSNDA